MEKSGKFNNLKTENSLYLRQHAENPIAWFSYGPEAIEKARVENKPIFLSIGYSSCHWCHVMAQESFSHPEIAEYLNQNFVSIKVDREEHPDIDQYYQHAAQIFTRNGGWPLSAFLLPDMRPYFTGTYYPPFTTKEHSGFFELLKELKRAFDEEKEMIEKNASEVTAKIAEGFFPKTKVEFQGHFPAPMAILEAIKDFYDHENGGFGTSPKFPQFAFYEWGVEQILEGMVEQARGEHIIKSIENMLMGGIFDHARGGIHRYAVDAAWKTPHFEKMLYDQAGLLRLLAKTSLVYPSPVIFDGLIKTLEYIEAEMMSEEGYFFAAQDAESEGVEGLYFTYSKQEFEDALNAHDDEEESLAKNREKLLTWFGFEGKVDNVQQVIYLERKYREEFQTTENWPLVRKARSAILKDRQERVPPATDTKGIASWNFMMLTSLIDVLFYCQIDSIRAHAERIFHRGLEGAYKAFLEVKATGTQEAQLLKIRHVTTREDSLPYLEDYVLFAEMQIRLYEISANSVFKENFEKTVDFIIKEFLVEDELKTRTIGSSELAHYPNISTSHFDSAFKSLSATFVGLVRRAAVLFADHELLEKIEPLKERLTHEILKNPLSGGEAMRALSYPSEVYRSIKIPAKWAREVEFIKFLPFFLSRFVISYNEAEESKWEICNLNACELVGEGLNDFLATLNPQKKEQNIESTKDEER